jgi:hypothetical protein
MWFAFGFLCNVLKIFDSMIEYFCNAQCNEKGNCCNKILTPSPEREEIDRAREGKSNKSLRHKEEQQQKYHKHLHTISLEEEFLSLG